MTETTEVADALTGEQAIATVRADPASVLLKPEIWGRFFAAIKKTLAEEPCDLSTEKGRKAVASKAYKVTQTKTAIEKGGIALSKAITARRNDYVDQLDKLAIETRAPLTAWEEAETARKAKCQDIISRIQRMANIELNDTSDGVINRLCEVETIELDEADFGDELAQAQETQRQAVETMNAAITRLEKEETDKAELKRLQDEEAERLRLAKIAEDEAEARRLADEEAAKVQPPVVEPELESEEAPAPAPVASEAAVSVASISGGFASGLATSSKKEPAVDPQTIVGRRRAARAAEDARRATQTALVEYAGLQRAEAFNVVQAIIDGHIPNLTFSVPS